MTDPTEALFCVKPDGHSGPHAGWIGGEWSVRDNWTDLRHPPIEQASVRPADPAEAVEVCPSCGGEGQRADGSLCSGCQGFGSIEQAAEAANRVMWDDAVTGATPEEAGLSPGGSAAVAPPDWEPGCRCVPCIRKRAAYADAIRKRGGA